MKIKVSKKTYNIIKYIYRLGGFIFILACILSYAYIFNKLCEAILMIIAFFITKEGYQYQFHANSTKECILTSILLFCCLITFVPKINYSLLLSPIVGVLLTYFSSKLGIIKFKSKQYDKLYLPIKLEYLDLYNCDYSEFIKRCNDVNLTDYAKSVAIDIFRNKLSHKEIAEKNSVNQQTISIQKQRLKKKLNP